MNSHSEWSEWTGTDLEWDQKLVTLDDFTFYQSTKWARHRANFGWQTHRLIYQGPEQCQAQVLTKRILGTTIAWIPGGPIADFEHLNSQFVDCLSAITGSKRLFIRLNSLENSSDQACNKLKRNKWKRTKSPLSSGRSLQINLTKSESTRKELLSNNWARNLHRGETRNSKPYEWKNFAPEAIAEIYGQLSRYKDLDSSSDTPSLEVIKSIVDNFESSLKIFRCDDEIGKPLAIRGAVLLGKKAWDIFAAATPQGRKQYSSYVTAWSLFDFCAKSEIATYDLSGVDPIKNKGVFDFKNGTGANQIEYVGEWEIGTPFFTQPIVGRLINYRKKL